MRWAWLLGLAVSAMPLQRTCSLDELRQQLLHAKVVVAACAVSATESVCDPSAVGPDDQVTLAGGTRRVEFGWLRLALADAPKSRNVAALASVKQRIEREAAELDAADPLTPAQLKDEQGKLREILANGDFPQPEPESFWARMWNRLIRWLEETLRRAGRGASSTQWISQILMLSLLGIGCGSLIWWLSRMRRKQGLVIKKPAAERTPDGSTGPEWEVWLAQARQLAQQQHWREAIHRVYWAAIARMESRGAWRADRARTPREYLELIDRQSAPGNDLALLTRALEQFWYGGRAASEQDYSEACGSLARLAAS
jgi:hypothetical protein